MLTSVQSAAIFGQSFWQVRRRCIYTGRTEPCTAAFRNETLCVPNGNYSNQSCVLVLSQSPASGHTHHCARRSQHLSAVQSGPAGRTVARAVRRGRSTWGRFFSLLHDSRIDSAPIPTFCTTTVQELCLAFHFITPLLKL